MKKKKFKRVKEDEGVANPSRKSIVSEDKKISKRDYFAGEALFSLVLRDEACNFSVEAYYVADHMLDNTNNDDWNPEVDLKDYFASKFISGVIQAKLDKKYSPKDAFEVADGMIESRRKESFLK